MGDKKVNIIVCPGSKKIKEDALELFPNCKVVEGGFKAPIHINGLSEQEAEDAIEWFGGNGVKVIKED